MVAAQRRHRRVFAIVCAFLFAAIPLVASDANHVIYLHGRIVQQRQDARPLHPEHGHYELEKIVAAFRDRGFVVLSEIRPKSASVSGAADGVVAQIGELLRKGVPPERITVIGASMGAGIALSAAARLQNPSIRVVVLGACLTGNARALLEQEGK